MPKEDVWQYGFNLPGMTKLPKDIGDARLVRKKRQPKRENPDVAAVFGYIKAERAVIYDNAVPPDFNQLTGHQQQIYWAIKGGEEKQAAAWRQQNIAADHGLMTEFFIVDEIAVIPDRYCGHCAAPIVRDTRIIQSGRGKKSGQTQLLVNEYCSNCNIAGVSDFQVWVPDTQIIKK